MNTARNTAESATDVPFRTPVRVMRPSNWAAWLVVPLLALLVWLGSPLAGILVGAALALSRDYRVLKHGSRLAEVGLQAAIVLLGFSLDIQTIWDVSRAYAPLVTVYVPVTLGAGLVLAYLLRIGPVFGRLIASGTAICGGTAIATLSPILRARTDQTAVALAIVFVLNMAALIVFPLIGHALGMSQTQFGFWVALAVHDTSSVIATAAEYGEEAASVAATIKLGRTIWLIPVAMMFSFDGATTGAKIRIPAFILIFVVASTIGTLLRMHYGELTGLFDATKALSGGLIVAALFFIGLQCTRDSLRNLRGRVVWQAIILWLAVVPATLLLALNFAP